MKQELDLQVGSIPQGPAKHLPDEDAITVISMSSAVRTDQPAPWQRPADRYLLERSLGSGTYGEVYLATDTELDRQVAIKVLRPEYARNEEWTERFSREARYVARVSPHPNVVTLFDLVREDDTIILVLEYVQGSDLRTLIAQHAPLPIARAVSIMEGVLAALAAAHSRGIVHRDVKPANVLLDEAGRIKLTDFGIAQAVVEEQLPSEGVHGTAAYMAPEQIRDQPVGVQADLYAAGVILFEMLTGRWPFTGDTALEVALKHVRERPPLPRSLNPCIPAALQSAMLRALRKDWRQRFSDADQMMAAVRAGAAAGEIVQRRVRALPPTPQIDKKETGREENHAVRRIQADPGGPKRTESASTEELPHAGSAARWAEAAVGERYEVLLRALGAYLDQEPSDRITLVELSDGFLLRKQRAFTFKIETSVQHLTRQALKQQLSQLQQERPRGRRVRHPGLWAALPQGHQDFFRALGHELDAVSARAIVIDEETDGLAVAYQRPGIDGRSLDRHVTFLRREHIEHIVNAAFERRIDPHRRFGLDESGASEARSGRRPVDARH